MLVADLVPFLLQIKLSKLLVYVGSRQRVQTHLFLPNEKTLGKGFLCVGIVTPLLVKNAEVQQTVSTGGVHHRPLIADGEDLLPNSQSLRKAGNCLMGHLTLVVVNAEQKVRVRSF